MAEEKRKGGRPPWEPTDRDRRQVVQLSAMGVAFEDIADILEVTPPTLRKHCWLDIQKGRVMGRARNSKRLHEAAEKGNVTAMIWLDKTRYGIQEPQVPSKKEMIEDAARADPKDARWDGLLQ